MTDWPGTEEPAWPGTEEPQQNFFDMPEADRRVSRLVPNVNHIMKGFSAFGEGFREGLQPETLGLSEESRKWLADKNVLPKDVNDYTNPMKPFMAFNEGIILPLAVGIDAIARSPMALYRGAQSLAIARGVPPDIASIPDAFMGSPHPLGIPQVQLDPPKPFVKQVDIKPIEGSPNPGILRTEAAKTGDPLIDQILDHPTMKAVIEKPVVDDSHTIPNSLGGSTPINNPTLYRDRDFPKTMTVDGVTFDTAEPSAVHENVEEFVIDALVKGGMDQATALKVAFWNFGEVAEDAWYRAHGMDPEHVEAQYTEYLDRIASRKVTKEELTPERTTANENLRTDAFEKLSAINKVIASSDFRPILVDGRMKFSSLNAEENRALNRIGFGRAPDVTFEQESNPFTAAKAWEANLQYWRSLIEPVSREAPQVKVKDIGTGGVKIGGVPPDLFRGTYPDGDPAKAGPGPIDKPTPQEVALGRQMLEKYLAGEGNPSGIVAFHGSPVSFQKFNTATVDVTTDQNFAERYRQPRGRGAPRSKVDLEDAQYDVKHWQFRVDTNPENKLYQQKLAEAEGRLAQAGGSVEQAFPNIQRRSGQYELPIKAGNAELGKLEFVVEDKNVEVRGAYIDSDYQGQGIGVANYKRLADWALSTGRELSSGSDVSAQASRMYSAMERRGYTVVRDPDLKTNHLGAASAPGRPAFRIVAGPERRAPGNLYQVSVGASPDDFLNLDKPLNEQSEQVKAALAKSGIGLETERVREAAVKLKDGRVLTGPSHLEIVDKLELDDLNGAEDGFVTNSGRFIDRAEAARISNYKGDMRFESSHVKPGQESVHLGMDLWDSLRDTMGADAAAAKLRDAGIAGTSRQHGVYSVFDPNILQITHVNGQPILDAARDLGVVGSPKAPLTEGKPAEAAARATDGGGGPRPPQGGGGPGGGGEPQQPSGNPWRDRFEHFVGKLETPDDVKQLIRESADEKGEFPVARQGDIPLAHVEAIAEAAGVEPGEVNQRGLGRFLKNDAEVRTAMQLMLQVTENVKAVARDVRADGSPENLIKLQEAIMRRDLAVEQVVGLRAEWGRTGNVFQEFLRDVKDQEALGNFLKQKGRTPADLRDIADAIDVLDRSQTARFMNDMRTPTAWDKFMWYWVNALISGPVTHAKYVVANATFAGYESAVVTPIAGVVGAVRRSLLGGQEGVFVGEAAARVWGIVAGTPDAIVAAAKAARTGLQTPLPGEVAQNIIPKQNKALPYQQKPIEGPVGTLIGLPSRGASAIHSFFNFLGYRASIEAQAYRQAVKEGPKPPLQATAPPPVAPGFVRFFHGGDNPTSGGGRWVNESEQYARNYRPGQSVHYVDIPNSWLDQHFPDMDLYRPSGGVIRQPYPSFEAPEQFAKQMKPVDQAPSAPQLNDSFWQRRQRVADNPTAEMMNNAIEEGYRLTYINELSPAGKLMSRAIKATKIGQLLLPFTHIPFNILSRGLEGTPAAFLTEQTRSDLFGKNGAVKQDMAVARLVAGSAVGAWAVNLVLNDRMTGYGPTDPKERAQWIATGHQPYSIRIGDEWYSFNRFGSLGTMLGLHANLAEAIPHLKPDSEELTKALVMTVHSTGRLLEDEVGMQGLAGLIDAINDPEHKGTRFISAFAGSLLPYSSALRQTASAMDPEMREVKSFVDGLRYYIPVMRQDLLPKRDWLGEPFTNAGYGGDLPIPGVSSIIQHRPAEASPIAEEMKRLDLHPAVPQNRVGGVQLPPKLYDQYQMAAGQLKRQVLYNWVAQPNWYQMPEFARAEIFRRSISATNQQAGAMIQGMYPQIIQQGVQQRVDQINGVKPTKLKD